MNRKTKASDRMKQFAGFLTRHVLFAVICCGLILIVAAGLYRFGPYSKKGEAKILTSSMLTDAIDISELSTAEFKYRGIAEIYANEQRTQVRCRVCYNAVVKAGIDMKDVQFRFDHENKTVTPVLPDIGLKVTIIDEQSMALLPSDADVGIDSMLKFSKEDVEKEARESAELLNTARENLKAAIEGLLFPILRAEGYSLRWN